MTAAAELLTPADPPAFFGVEASITGRRWVERAADEKIAAAHARMLSAPEALGRVLAARGVPVEEGEGFLNPSLKAHFPDPSSFADMDRASALLQDAVEAGRRIAVFADYDVDGATSAAQLIRYFRARGVEIGLYVPDRVKEGYGPSAEAFAELKRQGAEIVITVDCGAMAHGALESAAEMGLEVVVVDHHQMTAAPPKAAAVINPNRPDCASGCGHLAAAGVTFVLLVALNREARRRGAFNDIKEPDLLQLLDLTALGTFCDVVSLTGVNRAIAAQGLRVMTARSNPGIAALAEVGKMHETASAYHAGFVFGPRINAGGRVGRADMGARLLSTDDPGEAAKLAAELDALNLQRRAIEQAVLEDAIARLDADPKTQGASVLTVAAEGWHPGVIGIVAGRVKERYAKPAVVIALDEEHVHPGKGSGRSVEGVDLGAAIAAAREAGLLIAGGGHPMACGLTVEPDKVDEVARFLDAHVAALGPLPPRTLKIDAAVSASGLTRALADAVAHAGPFGPGNPEPVFAAPDLRVKGWREIGTGHVKATLEDAGGAKVEAIAFRALDTELGKLLTARDAKLHAAVKIKVSKGRYLDVQIEDAAPA